MSNVRKAANGTTVDCAVFQDQLPGLFESGEDLNTQEHLKTCENCSALVQQAKLLLPIHDPSPEVWENIQTALKKEPSRRE
jgi:predicted anti-sigma-YlaC factor YlaD